MDSTYIAGKILATERRLGQAVEAFDSKKQLRLCLLLLVLHRMAVRNVMDGKREAVAELRATRRAMAKGKENGVEIPLLEIRVRKLEEERDVWGKALASLGWRIMDILDLWEQCGAQLSDLAALCNLQYESCIQKIGVLGNTADDYEDFSKLVLVYNLDYKAPRDRGWIDDEVDAPLTHAVKAHMLDMMLHTPEGREASHRALEECFPEIMENALTLVTDADGIQHFIDKDGVEVGTVGEGD